MFVFQRACTCVCPYLGFSFVCNCVDRSCLFPTCIFFSASVAAPAAAAAAAAPAATAAVPDYSKQWDEYLKQTGK